MMYENKLFLEEKTLSLFQLDTLLFDAFHQTVRSITFLHAEKRLMLAVLEDAVTCFTKYRRARDRKKRRPFDEAREWVLERESDWPFAFDNICDALGLDSDYLRQGLLGDEWKTAQKDSKTARTAPEGKRRKKCRATVGMAA